MKKNTVLSLNKRATVQHEKKMFSSNYWLQRSSGLALGERQKNYSNWRVPGSRSAIAGRSCWCSKGKWQFGPLGAVDFVVLHF
jgi:hypothetical protein